MAILVYVLTGCSSVKQKKTDDAVYMYDMTGAVNGTVFNGVGVIPYAPSYEMEVSSLVNIDLITISSCHRDFHQESAIQTNWLQPKRSFKYVYKPTQGIENDGSCLVRMGAYTKTGGQAAWAVLDFQTPDATLPALNMCNGETQRSAGVSICQSRAGLIQRMAFSNPVEISQKADPRCRMNPVDERYTIWEAPLAAGECVIIFGEIAKPHRQHRHTTVSYTDIIIRGQ